MAKPGFYAAGRLALRRKLRTEKDMGFFEINEAMSAVDNSLFDTAVASVAGARAEIEAIGDGRFIQAIIDFFQSERGQAILDALLKLLFGLLLEAKTVALPAVV